MSSLPGRTNPNYRHGGNVENKPEYNSWRAMRARCNDVKYVNYKHYGGRGIKVCERWDDSKTGFMNFLEDMGKKPDPKLTLDRIDTNGNYEPSNCRWADQKTQVRNSSTPRFITIGGIEDTFTAQIKRFSPVSTALVYKRLRQGWDPVMAILCVDTGRAALHERRRQAKEAKLATCIVCGSKCKSSHAKFCGNVCRETTRGFDGRFHGVTASS